MAQAEPPMASSVIVARATIVQMLHSKDARTFSEYASNVFIPYNMSKLHNAMHLDLVQNRYIEDSLKGMAKAKHGKRVHR